MIIISNSIKISEEHIENLKFEGINVIAGVNTIQFSEDIYIEVESLFNEEAGV